MLGGGGGGGGGGSSRVSDKVIRRKSNFLYHLEQDNVTLADRGFTDLAIHEAKLEFSAFTHGKSHLTQREVKYSPSSQFEYENS